MSSCKGLRARDARRWCVVALLFAAPLCAFELDINDFDEDGDTLESMSEATAYGMHEKGAERLNAAREVSPLAVDAAFGDRISLFHGTVTFDNVDISVPGNSSLPVELRRTLPVRDRRMTNDTLGGFGDWDVDVPHLSGTFLKNKGWTTGPNSSANRCDVAEAPDNTALFLPDDFWDGYVLHVPGQGDQQLLASPSATLPAPPGPANTYPWITRAMWRIRCKPTTANNHGGQGFIAVSPDGISYHLDHVIVRDAPGISAGWTNGPGSTEARVRIYFAVTRVEDRHGNHVTYAWGENGLQSITSSDGVDNKGVANPSRQIVLAYTGGRISSATSSVGTWIYGYDGNARLQTVTRPDTSTWRYQHNGGMGIVTSHFPPLEDPSTPCMSTLENASTDYALTVTHPAGGVATFDFDALVHGRSNVPDTCVRPGDGSYRYWQIPHDSLTMSLASKTVSGTGLPTMAWAYAYNVAAGPAVPCENTPQCQSTTSHAVTGPDNTWSRYTFGIRYGMDEGKLLKEEQGSSATAILRTTAHTFLASASGQPFPGDVGVHPMLNSDPQDRRLRPHKQTQITQQGRTFTRTVDTYDVFARPLSVTRSSNVTGSTARTEVTTYHDHTASWTLGQVKKVQVGTLVPVETIYNPTSALPEQFKRFDKLHQTLAYDSAANVTSVTDGNSNVITLDSWYRGIPRTVTFADATTQTSIVNASGWITDVTDQMGYTTKYGYDAMGRVNLVTYPTADDVTWNTTSQAFQRVSAAPTGDDVGFANHWRQTVSTGNARRVTYYDGLWRPLLTREYDNQNATTIAATRSVQRMSYDHAGRTTFASYPAATDATATTGTRTTYDSLGRPTLVRQDNGAGTLDTATEYLSGFQTRITPPNGAQTTTSYVAWDIPDLDWPRQIVEPEGATTTIARDVFGKPTSLTRSGSYAGTALSHVRRYVYDGHQRLCKTIEPEGGATVLAYDGADNIAWRATGLALSSTTDCNNTSTTAGSGVPDAQRSLHTYDTANRLLTINHPGDTADVSYAYHADGSLHTASTTATTAFPNTSSVWTYAYNKRRLLKSESLSHAGRTFAITHAYNANGHRRSLTTPGNPGIDYAPNALGRPTMAGTYAHTASYHPNGAIAAFTYGNGATRAVTLNARKWPEWIRDTKNTTPLLDHTLTYDVQGNVSDLDIIETVGSGPSTTAHTRTFSYDGRDRLTGMSSTSAAVASETYLYDPLDNVRSVTRAGVEQRYHYGATTHRLDRIATPTGETRVAYTWTARGELATRTDTTTPPPTPPNRVFADGFETGFPVTLDTYTFDTAGRMVAFNATTERYAYDAHGHRLQSLRPSTAGGRLHVYTRAGQLVYEEDTWTDTVTDYVHLGAQLVAKRTRPIAGGTATATYLHADHRGTPAAESNTGGTLTRRQRLGAYGLPDDGQYRDGPGFTGHVTDEVTRLTYMQQRYYDPQAMRFISMDPVMATPGSFNRYWYADNNPLRFVDPDGRQTMDSMRAHPGIPRESVQGAPSSGSRMRSENPAQRKEDSGVSEVCDEVCEIKRIRAQQLGTVRLAGETASTMGDVVEAVAPIGVIGKGKLAVRGASSLYDDITLAGSRYVNRSTNVTKLQFEKNLLDEGFVRSVSKDGKAIIMEKDGARYMLRDEARSTGGPTADYYRPGSTSVDIKIRLESEVP